MWPPRPESGPVPPRSAAPAWRPLLSGPLAERAHRAREAIVSALSGLDPRELRAGLALGSAGLALFFDGLASSRPELRGRARAWLDHAGACVSEQVMDASLLGGLSGIAWVTDALEGASDDEDPCAEIDSALLEHLASQDPKQGNFDLGAGWLGIGVYALQRLPRPGAERLAARVVELLEARAESQPQGLTWRTAEGRLDLGLAHGVAGAVTFLADALASGVETSRAAHLLERGAEWLGARRRSGTESLFPAFTGDEVPSRLGWCYGDLAVATALARAGVAANESRWLSLAQEIARAASSRRLESARVVDAGLCHGAAGIAHLFNRLAQALRDDVLADAARRWFAHALELQRQGEGIAGFRAYVPSPPAPVAGFRADPGFLTGAAGVGLALDAALSSAEPRWDRVLLLSRSTGAVNG